LRKRPARQKNMLIRDVPEDLWTEVRRYCQDQGIHLREFMAQAMESLRGAEDQDAAKLTKRGARGALASIEQQVTY